VCAEALARKRALVVCVDVCVGIAAVLVGIVL
jgi:hypothetical protein